jgi:hypothetical protein
MSRNLPISRFIFTLEIQSSRNKRDEIFQYRDPRDAQVHLKHIKGLFGKEFRVFFKE